MGTDVDMQVGRMPCEDGGRGRDAVLSQGAPKMAQANRRKLGEQPAADSASQPQEEPTLLAPPARTAGLGL